MPGTAQYVPHAALLRREAVALHGGGDAVADFDVDDAGLGAFDREVEVVALRPLGFPEFFGGVEVSTVSSRKPFDDEQLDGERTAQRERPGARRRPTAKRVRRPPGRVRRWASAGALSRVGMSGFEIVILCRLSGLVGDAVRLAAWLAADRREFSGKSTSRQEVWLIGAW